MVVETYFYALTSVIIIFVAFQKWVMFCLVLEITSVICHKYHWVVKPTTVVHEECLQNVKPKYSWKLRLQTLKEYFVIYPLEDPAKHYLSRLTLCGVVSIPWRYNGYNKSVRWLRKLNIDLRLGLMLHSVIKFNSVVLILRFTLPQKITPSFQFPQQHDPWILFTQKILWKNMSK